MDITEDDFISLQKCIKDVICFLGFSNSYPKLDEKYLTDLENNWQSFIEQYYGDYYDFSK